MGQRERGFTLLELLVVLMILALGAAVATPAVMRLVASVGRQNQIDQAMLVLQSLPVTAMRQNRAVELPETSGYSPALAVLAQGNQTIQWPAETQEALRDFRIWLPQPITYRANGACTGGDTYWELAGGFRLLIRLEAPVCRPVRPS